MTLKYDFLKIIIVSILTLLLAACGSSTEPGQADFPGRGDQGFNAQGEGPLMIITIVSEATGLEVETIREQSANGVTLAEIITANGGDVEQVKVKLVEGMMARPNASEAEVKQRVEQILNNPLPQRNFRSGQPASDGN